MAGRPIQYDLTPYREEVEVLYSEGASQSAILTLLRESHDINMSKESLKRWLARWNLKSLRYQNQPDPINGITISRIEFYFFRHRHNDVQIVEDLRQEGINTSTRQVRDFRHKKLWIHRNMEDDTQEVVYQETLKHAWNAVVFVLLVNGGEGTCKPT